LNSGDLWYSSFSYTLLKERKKEGKYIYWTAHTSKTDTEVTEKTEVNTHK
jgi:hypothetical protein